MTNEAAYDDDKTPISEIPKLELTDDAPEHEYLHGYKLWVVTVGVLLAIFLVALDQTIIATALPKIVSEFDALSQVTWVATAYFLTQAGFMLFWGQVLSLSVTKPVFLAFIALFELGSLLCAVAPTMPALIFGRAVAGMGAGGIFNAAFTVGAQIAALEQRPLLFGSAGAVFALSSILGPLMGGAFTDKVSWRWCFYINLPIGAVSVLVLIMLLPRYPAPVNQHFPRLGWKKYIDLDWIGTAICLAMTTSLLLPLQWGGNTKPWSSPQVYALFPIFGVLVAAFVAWEHRLGPRAIMPLSMFRSRTQIGACLAAFFIFFCLLIGSYYLPLWFQATRGVSATSSGISILPFMLANVIVAGGVGAIVSTRGRYWHFIVVSPLLTAIGSGLLYTTDVHTPSAALIGFQILFGAGIGGAFQNTILSVQAEYADAPARVPQATSLVNFTQLMGGVIGLAAAGTLFSNKLASGLPADLPPAARAAVVSSVEAIKLLLPALQAGVVNAYVQALRPVFVLGVPTAALASLSALLIKNHSLKERGAAVAGGVA